MIFEGYIITNGINCVTTVDPTQHIVLSFKIEK